MANKNWLDNLVIEPVTADPSGDMARLDSLGLEVVNLSQSIVRLDAVHVMVVWDETSTDTGSLMPLLLGSR